MPIVRNTSGHEIVHVANLKDTTIHVDDLEGLQTSANTLLTTANTHHSSVNSKLPSALTGSGNLKVCIQELGNEGSERLNVDIGDSVSSKLPTALTGSGNLKVSIQETFGSDLALSVSTRSSEVSIASAATVSASSQIGSDINIGTSKSIIVYGSATANHNFHLEHSSNGSTWFLHSEIAPVLHGAIYHYMVKIEDGLQYYRLMNSLSTNIYTLNYIKL